MAVLSNARVTSPPLELLSAKCNHYYEIARANTKGEKVKVSARAHGQQLRQRVHSLAWAQARGRVTHKSVMQHLAAVRCPARDGLHALTTGPRLVSSVERVLACTLIWPRAVPCIF